MMQRQTIAARYYITALFILLFAVNCKAQRFYTKTGKVNFFSKAPLENIEAENATATAILNTKDGKVQFSILIKGFEFQKALMQEHFNENYLESSKYPKSMFDGQVVNNADINYGTDGNYIATIKGMLTIHGVTKEIETTGNINVANGIPTLIANFPITLSDYKISIPSLVKDKISSTVKITVNCVLNNSLK